MNQGKTLGIELTPTLLSIWSGSKCPVEYNQIEDNRKYNEVVNYVTLIGK